MVQESPLGQRWFSQVQQTISEPIRHFRFGARTPFAGDRRDGAFALQAAVPPLAEVSPKLRAQQTFRRSSAWQRCANSSHFDTMFERRSFTGPGKQDDYSRRDVVSFIRGLLHQFGTPNSSHTATMCCRSLGSLKACLFAQPLSVRVEFASMASRRTDLASSRWPSS